MLIAPVLLQLGLLTWQQPAAKDPFEAVRFLLGTWHATAAGSRDFGSYSFALDLKDHVIVRSAPNGDHNDVLYIYTDAPDTKLKAIYFDNEGHTIHYTLTAPAPNSIVFSSDMFRLTYDLRAGVMSGKFQAKVPGKDDFISHLEWSGKADGATQR